MPRETRGESRWSGLWKNDGLRKGAEEVVEYVFLRRSDHSLVSLGNIKRSTCAPCACAMAYAVEVRSGLDAFVVAGAGTDDD